MYKVLFCLEKKDFHHLVDVSRHYAGASKDGGYIFNKKGYEVEFYKEKKINGVDCVIFGWSRYELDKYNYDVYGVNFEKDHLKNGYILMEFEDGYMVNFKNRSKIPELAEAMNISKIITRDDFSIILEEKNNQKEEEEFE